MSRHPFSYPPTTDAILHQRWGVGNLTIEQAADVCGVSIKTWQRYESGITTIPKTSWYWLVTYTSGLIYHKNWDGWSFNDNKLITPEGYAYTPGEIRSIFFYKQMYRSKKITSPNVIQINLGIPEDVYIERLKWKYKFQSLMHVLLDLKSSIEDTDDHVIRSLSNQVTQSASAIVNSYSAMIKSLPTTEILEKESITMGYLSTFKTNDPIY